MVGVLFYEIGQVEVAMLGTAVDLVSLRRGRGAVMSSLFFLFLSPPPQDGRLQKLIGSLSSGSQSAPEFQSKHLSQILPGSPSGVFMAMSWKCGIPKELVFQGGKAD